MGVVDTSTSQGHKFCIQSLFGALDTPLKRSNQGVHIMFGLTSAFRYMIVIVSPKEHCLGPQNALGNLGPKKTIEKLPIWKLYFQPVE
jgi:hypothetical protein